MKFYRPPEHQQGLTILELLTYVTVLAIAGVFIAAQADNIQSGTQVERAYAEIDKVKNAALAYRDLNVGDFGSISMTNLSTDGYNIDPFSDGLLENTYGLDVTITQNTTNNSQADLVYDFPHSKDCNQLKLRFDPATDQLIDSATCAADTNLWALTLVIGFDP